MMAINCPTRISNEARERPQQKKTHGHAFAKFSHDKYSLDADARTRSARRHNELIESKYIYDMLKPGQCASSSRGVVAGGRHAVPSAATARMCHARNMCANICHNIIKYLRTKRANCRICASAGWPSGDFRRNYAYNVALAHACTMRG